MDASRHGVVLTTLVLTLVAVASTLIVLVPAVAGVQPGGETGANFEQFQLAGFSRLAAGFLSTLLVGGFMLVVASDAVDRIVTRVREDAVIAFLWGIGVFVGILALLLTLVLTDFDAIVPFPLSLVFVVIVIIGNTLGYLALLSGNVDNHWIALVAAAVLTAVLVMIPVIGNLLGVVVGSLGIGAMVREIVD